jgi:hypothetical protein
MRKASAALLSAAVMICTACAPPSATSTAPAASQPAATDTSAPAPTTSVTTIPNGISLSDLSGTAFVFPQAVPPEPECDGAPPSNLIVHERGQVTNDDPQPLNVREQPGLAGDIVGILRSLDIFYVMDGPRCADDYTWFRIRAGPIDGWIAEGEPGLYYVAPYLQ